MSDNQELSRTTLIYRASARVWLTILLVFLLGPIGNLITAGRIRSAKLLAYLVVAMIVGGSLDSAIPFARRTFAFSSAGQFIVAAVACGYSVGARERLKISDRQARNLIESGDIG
jgi:hypothetical protein